ncbi:MAG: DUF1015 domain-containing protein [Chloroflexi bacterium]|nr:MAG: DUF1015 domain-containing protein [Chloroflexota bacterium]
MDEAARFFRHGALAGSVARVLPLRAVRFDPENVDLGRVLAPPYDVIGADDQARLYADDLRNIVRIDYGQVLPDDRPGSDDRYTRAAGHLRSWMDLGILVRDPRPAYYVSSHRVPGVDDGERTRVGIFARIPARPWDEAEIRPHERTLRAPKADRLALMRATGMQTSPVFALWDRAPGLDRVLEAVTAAPPAATGRSRGELGREHHQLWVADDPDEVTAISAALSAAHLYVADGHHRYETAAAFAEERRAVEPEAPPDADFALALVYLCAAADPAAEVLPTHRLVRPGDGVPSTVAELGSRLDGGLRLEARPDLAAAAADMRALRPTHHAFAILGHDGAALLSTERRPTASPRDSLDVVVLQDQVLIPACGLDPERIDGGALGYTRDPNEAEQAIASGAAAIALLCNSASTAEIIAVADAHEVMPQKSTYFYPKVPTGLVLSPL